MKYAPSSELMRVAEQRNANHIRKQAWLARSAKHRYQHPYYEKHGDIDVSSEQETLDPDYQKWLDDRSVEDKAHFDSLDKLPF